MGLALTLIALSPRNAAALTALLAMAFWPAIVVALRWRQLQLPSGRSLIAIGLAALAVAIVAARSAFAFDPRVSLIGTIGQHAGSLTWLAAWSVLAVAAVSARPADLGRSARAIAVAGGVLALGGLLDRAGVFAALRFSLEPSGFMENSVSLAQVLVVATCAATAWFFGSRSTAQRLGAGVAAVLCLAGLLAADSAAAWVGLVVGTALASVVLVLAKRARLSPVLTALLLVSLLVVGTGVLVVALGDGVSPGIETRLATASNDRFTIWTSAVSQFQRAPLLGEGAEQFSAWVRWDLEQGPALVKTGTYDPHMLGLWWLLAGGIVGTIAALAAAAALAERILSLLTGRPSPSLAALLAGCIAWVVSALFAWTSPLALGLVALVAGVAVGVAGSKPDKVGDGVGERRWLRLSAAIVPAATGLAVAAALLLGGASYEYQWARRVDRGTSDPNALVAAAVATGDPSLASMAVTELFGTRQAGATQQAEQLRPILDGAARWHVDAAFSRFQLAAVTDGADDEAAWNEVESALRDGAEADPASGLWAAMGALQAQASGRTGDAETYAEMALDKPLPEQARIQLQDLVP